jgi:hypothetical protein
VQRLRATQDLLRRGQGEQPALSVQQADVSPQPDTIEENVSVELASATTAPTTLIPRVTPILRVTVIPPSSIPPRATPTAPATLTSRVISTPSASPISSALKSCDALKAEIQSKLDAKNITGYALTIMTSGDLKGPNVVGSCEGNTKKIVLNRSRNAP